MDIGFYYLTGVSAPSSAEEDLVINSGCVSLQKEEEELASENQSELDLAIESLALTLEAKEFFKELQKEIKLQSQSTSSYHSLPDLKDMFAAVSKNRTFFTRLTTII
jgi:hypothetical protein